MARWHPARGVDLPVIRWELKTRPARVVVRLPDGSGLCVPLNCTDAGVVCEPNEAGRPVRFTVDALLELATLVEAFAQRGSS